MVAVNVVAARAQRRKARDGFGQPILGGDFCNDELGRGDAETVEVLSGLEPGMRVVADPRGLSDGAAVRVRTAGAAQEPR